MKPIQSSGEQFQLAKYLFENQAIDSLEYTMKLTD